MSKPRECYHDFHVPGSPLLSERVHMVEASAYEAKKSACGEWIRRHKKICDERDALKAQLAEVTRERDEVSLKLRQTKAQNERLRITSKLDRALKAEAKAERYKEAIKLYEQAFDDTGCDYSHLVCLQAARKALTDYPTEACKHPNVPKGGATFCPDCAPAQQSSLTEWSEWGNRNPAAHREDNE